MKNYWIFSPVVDVLVETQSMSEAVKIAHKLANKKDYVLLSPACASFDLFKNFEGSWKPIQRSS